jgi:hypothetical protein
MAKAAKVRGKTGKGSPAPKRTPGATLKAEAKTQSASKRGASPGGKLASRPSVSMAAPAVRLYDLVCPVEGRLAAGLSRQTCVAQARQHNATPGHNAACV